MNFNGGRRIINSNDSYKNTGFLILTMSYDIFFTFLELFSFKSLSAFPSVYLLGLSSPLH